jgi:hypothetical protein
MSIGNLWEAGAKRGGRLFAVTLANVGLVVLIIGVVVSIVTPLLKTAQFFESSPPLTPIFEPLLTELGYALLIAAIIILTTERHSRIEFNRLVQEQLSTVDKTIAEGLSRVFRSIDLMHLLDKLNRSPQAEIRLISRKIYSKYVDGLEAIEGGFQVDDLNWGPEAGPSLTAAARDGRIPVRAGMKEWLRRGPNKKNGTKKESKMPSDQTP